MSTTKSEISINHELQLNNKKNKKIKNMTKERAGVGSLQEQGLQRERHVTHYSCLHFLQHQSPSISVVRPENTNSKIQSSTLIQKHLTKE